MSEFKKTCANCAGRFPMLVGKDCCDMTNKRIEDDSAVCDAWEVNNNVLVKIQATENAKLKKQLKKSLEREAAIEKELDAARKMLRLAAYFANDKCPDEFQGACPHKHSSCEDCWIDSWQREVKSGNGRCKECENQGIAKTQ